MTISSNHWDSASPPGKGTYMYSTLTTLIDRLESPQAEEADVIGWGAPVPAFGNPFSSKVATVGLNPSNREFVDESGAELDGSFRRFHTLSSLGIKSWSDADARHLESIILRCCMYFYGNPYDIWFRKLDKVISGTKKSFYRHDGAACHLDLIPYATARKWTELTPNQRTMLSEAAGNSLGMLIGTSSIRMLILNGMTVVREFQSSAKVQLQEQEMENWSLPRKSGKNVAGYSYFGLADRLFDVELPRTILILGYNHNLQSSFGVTNDVISEIRNWIAEKYAAFAT